MFSHVMLGADDIDASKSFYDASLGTLGVQPGRVDPMGRVMYLTQSGLFILTKPLNGEPASCGNGSTIGFSADSPEAVEAWHKTGAASGGTPIENPPGIREMGPMKLYLAYLRDPAGNKLCAMHRVAA